MDASKGKAAGKDARLYRHLDSLGGCHVPQLAGRYLAYTHRKQLADSGLYRIPFRTADGAGQLTGADLAMDGSSLLMVAVSSPFGLRSYQHTQLYRGDSIYQMNPLARIRPCETKDRENVLSDPAFLFFDGSWNGIVACENKGTVGRLVASTHLDVFHRHEQQVLLEDAGGTLSSSCGLDVEGCGYLFYVRTAGNDTQVMRVDDLGCDDDQKHLTYGTSTTVQVQGLPEGAQILGFGLLGEQSLDKVLVAGEGLTGILRVQVQGDQGPSSVLYQVQAAGIDAPWRVGEEWVLPSYVTDVVASVERASLIPQTGDILLSCRETDERAVLCVVPGLRDKMETAGDFLDSYRVFSNVFHSGMSYERFKYKHQGNPFRVPTYYLQTQEGTQTIGTNCFMGALGLAHDEDILMVQSCDTAVMPEGRGKGVFTGIIARAEEALAQEGVDLLVGFPNDNSLHGFQKRGWDYLGDLATYRKVVDKGAARLSKLPFRFKAKDGRGSEGTPVSVCPLTEADLDVINASSDTLFKRTLDYYRWKVDDNEGLSYLVEREGDSLKAFAVYRRSSGTVTVMDWWAAGEDPSTKSGNFRCIADSLASLGHTVVVYLVNKVAGEDLFWEALGYADADHPIHFITKPLSDKGRAVGADLSSWSLRFIDADTAIG